MSLRRHARFFVALTAGAAVAVAAPAGLPMRVLLAGDAFFLVYLVLTAVLLAGVTPSHLREWAVRADEGIAFLVLLTVAAVTLSLGAVFLLLRQGTIAGPLEAVVAIASVPLGWLTIHTLAAFHYANLYYRPARDGRVTRRLDFPGTPEPGPVDFLYFSFVLGMTAQVSDVTVRTSRLRATALAHGVAAFFYNAVILAIAVNAALAYAG